MRMPAGAGRQRPGRLYVLDSYALLAYLEGEAGGARVGQLLEAASQGRCRLLMSVVNLGEVAYIVERERGLPRAQEALARIDELPVEVVVADRTLVLEAAHLKAHHPLAYADCLAAALARLHGAALVTGDAEFRHLEGEVPIEWLPQPRAEAGRD